MPQFLQVGNGDTNPTSPTLWLGEFNEMIKVKWLHQQYFSGLCCTPGTILSTSPLLTLNRPWTLEGAVTVIPILQMWKLRHRAVKECAQSQRANNGRSRSYTDAGYNLGVSKLWFISESPPPVFTELARKEWFLHLELVKNIKRKISLQPMKIVWNSSFNVHR